MKNILSLIIFLFFAKVTAQNLTEINLNLRLSDSLIYQNEIRIYQGGGKINFSSFFRMFKDKSGKWISEFYDRYGGGRILKSKNNTEFVWENILRTNIQFLPDMKEISYKMRKRRDVELVDGKYELRWSTMAIMDGVGYKIQIKTDNEFNTVNYSNPEKYLKYYPEVDELIYFSELLYLIRNEFDLWKK